MYKIDNPKNNYKNVAHAFFLALAITIAEPSTILPLIVHHFSNNVIMVGIFVSLLRGGAIVIQLYAAFHAQAYKRVLPYLGKVFFARWLAWLSIGLSIYFIGDSNKPLTLFSLVLVFFSSLLVRVLEPSILKNYKPSSFLKNTEAKRWPIAK